MLLSINGRPKRGVSSYDSHTAEHGKRRPHHQNRPDLRRPAGETLPFPAHRLRQIKSAKGDFVIYYEPRRASSDLSSQGGRQAYFAIARIVEVRPDLSRADHFYADVNFILIFQVRCPFVKDCTTTGRGPARRRCDKQRCFRTRCPATSGRCIRRHLQGGFASVLGWSFYERSERMDGSSPACSRRLPRTKDRTLRGHDRDWRDLSRASRRVGGSIACLRLAMTLQLTSSRGASTASISTSRTDDVALASASREIHRESPDRVALYFDCMSAPVGRIVATNAVQRHSTSYCHVGAGLTAPDACTTP